jgi:hypothetical protein
VIADIIADHQALEPVKNDPNKFNQYNRYNLYNHNKPLALPQMIVMRILTTVYSHLMDHMKTVVVLPGYNKEDHAVVTWTLSINNNVTLLVIVTTMVALYLEHVVNEPPNKPN